MKSLVFSSFVFICLGIAAQNRAGLNIQKEGSLQGYVLFAPLYSKTTYLIDKCGKVVQSWKSRYNPGQSAYLLDNGDLLRTGNDSNKVFRGGGVIERYDWNNTLLWSYSISNATECQHHDICPLPNGNILVLAWEIKSREEALKAGRKPEILAGNLWSEKIIEIRPQGKNKAKVVWEWHAWDHLVQDYDAAQANFGDVRKRTELIHINASSFNDADFLHFNAITYNAELDQILVSNRNYSEIFILDHSTSSAEAASHSGGKHNKGGDLLYRFGNPSVYKSDATRLLFGQHSPYWIEKGMKDEGKILLFNNGMGRRLKPNYSSIELITPPMDKNGSYGNIDSTAHERLYMENETENLGGVFYSTNVSNAQRLSNGNLLVCSGATGQFCELDANRNIVWLYVNPVAAEKIAPQHTIANLNPVFRCTFYEAAFKGFKGKKLQAGKPIEQGLEYDCMKGER